MIVYVVAMREEAQPLIDHLDLRPCKRATLFPVFHREHAWLAISGVGKANAAAAVTELYHVCGRARDGVWINVGIAGHPNLPLGTLRSAHRIADAAGGQRWYPPQVLLQHVASSALTCVDTPENAYPDDSLYDMESAGFFPAAVRCGTAEAVQCLKIVSDNRAHGTEQLSPRSIADAVAAKAAAVVDTANSLHAATRCLREHEPAPEVSALLARHRFSVTQQRQLLRLSQRLAARAPAHSLLDDTLHGAATAREVLRRLERRLDALAVFPERE